MLEGPVLIMELEQTEWPNPWSYWWWLSDTRQEFQPHFCNRTVWYERVYKFSETISMNQSLSLEANRLSANQEIPCNGTKTLESILSHIDPVHSFTHSVFMICFAPVSIYHNGNVSLLVKISRWHWERNMLYTLYFQNTLNHLKKLIN
jgi:hypothetical protein